MDILSNMHLSDHSELIAATTKLWELLDTLAIRKPGASLQSPPYDTGIHLADNFNVDTALTARFTPEAVNVTSALSYLHVS
jgi:hypothetical protein